VKWPASLVCSCYTWTARHLKAPSLQLSAIWTCKSFGAIAKKHNASAVRHAAVMDLDVVMAFSW
jgi:hypothetical protein